MSVVIAKRIGLDRRAVEEMLRQTEEDADKEILELKTRYEKGTESTEQRRLNDGLTVLNRLNDLLIITLRYG